MLSLESPEARKRALLPKQLLHPQRLGTQPMKLKFFSKDIILQVKPETETYSPRLNSVNVAHAVGDQCPKKTRTHIPHEPGTVTERLFIPFVEHGRKDTESWGNCSLSDSEKETRRLEPRSILGSSRAHQDPSPDQPGIY